MYGWAGTVLRVDLNREKTVKQPLDPKVAKDFIGGRGLNSKVLFDEVKPGIDPLGPDNVVCFGVGPLTGTSFTSSGRIHVSTLSPYSYILGDGNSGGYFPSFLKFAGYDQIVVTGRASKPRYVLIDDGTVQVKDASKLWGRDVWETTDMIQEEHGKEFRVSAIGQAGENLVRFASTMFDKYCSAARGSGAVMGVKNLKAIAVRTTNRKIQLADKEEAEKLAMEERKFFITDKTQRKIAKYGTHLGMLGWWPGYRYFKRYLSEKDVPEDLKPEGWKKYEEGRDACYGCAVSCKNVYRIPEGKYKGEKGEGLEYETIYCLGTNCGVMDPISILTMGNLGDKYGMCTIPLGNTIALAKQLWEKGILTEKDTEGLSLDWENSSDQIELIHRIALRSSKFGSILAEGMYSMAKIIGKGAMEHCYHVKGLCRGPSDYPAGVFTLAHATSTRGADHLRGRGWAFGENDPDVFPELQKKGFVPQEPVPALRVSENACTLADSLGRCKGSVNNWAAAVPLVFRYPLWGGVVKVLNAVTGAGYTTETLPEALERIYTIERALLIRQGITRRQDRIVQRPEQKGTPDGIEEAKNHEKMLTQYYQLRGWDKDNGVPTRATLERLGLKNVADELEKHGPYKEWDGPPLWPLEKYPHGENRS